MYTNYADRYRKKRPRAHVYAIGIAAILSVILCAAMVIQPRSAIVPISASDRALNFAKRDLPKILRQQFLKKEVKLLSCDITEVSELPQTGDLPRRWAVIGTVEANSGTAPFVAIVAQRDSWEVCIVVLNPGPYHSGMLIYMSPWYSTVYQLYEKPFAGMGEGIGG